MDCTFLITQKIYIHLVIYIVYQYTTYTVFLTILDFQAGFMGTWSRLIHDLSASSNKMAI